DVTAYAPRCPLHTVPLPVSKHAAQVRNRTASTRVWPDRSTNPDGGPPRESSHESPHGLLGSDRGHYRRRSFTRLPPRIASFCASGISACRMESTVSGQTNGISVPYTI